MDIRMLLSGCPRRMGRARRCVRDAVVRQSEVGISSDVDPEDVGEKAVGADSRNVDWSNGASCE